MTAETWTAKHDEAVMLVAEDKLTDTTIAAQLGISKRTLELWKREALFGERFDAAVAEIRAALLKRGIARVDRRLARLDKTWLDLQSVIEQRAAEMRGICPGGDTGLVVKREKPGGEFTITEYAVDTGLLSELRALEMQAAKELGQWVERKASDVTSGGKRLAAGPDLRGLSPDRLAQLEEILSEAEDGRGAANASPGEGGAVPA